MTNVIQTVIAIPFVLLGFLFQWARTGFQAGQFLFQTWGERK